MSNKKIVEKKEKIKAFYISKKELAIIVYSLGDTIDFFEQVVEENPEEKEFLDTIDDLYADLNFELKTYEKTI
jgi:Asp-tRNA(Asn)/Glu-tRNA(Gln) amidotransferase C subunit